MRLRGVVVCALMTMASALAACGEREPKPGTVQDEAMRAGVTAEQLVKPTDDYFHDMDSTSSTASSRCSRSRKSKAGTCGWSGRAATIACGTRLTVDSLGTLRSAQDDFLASAIRAGPTRSPATSRVLPLQATAGTIGWEYLGLVNEPCFKEATGPGSEPLRAVARRRAIRPARRIRLPTRTISGREDRRARHDRAGRVLLRRADRHRRPAPVSQSRLRREGAAALERGSLLQRSRRTTPTRIWSGRIGSACRARSATSGPTRSSRRPIPKTRSGRT